ncbi:hypothetical protein [Hymenobacter crusticola]|uniref:Uncharacterized protein n=1 Tax=Hymenobacter crusticola TaxID=1770526 RepID=A0A243WHY4_9BACT|nr:hypothetical protein [Hymenobacter crusticola]OUJ75451.1 hypothetical protein BXP70_05415 [Hymenobacter crusticola]
METTSHTASPQNGRTSLGRQVATAQQIKDTLTILGMNVLLVFGILFGIGIPGLILYGLRWKLTRGGATPTRAIVLWALTTVHEVLCVALFFSTDMQAELHEWATYLGWGYALGVLISLVGVVEAATNSSSLAESLPQ